jgi:hypothetical protein
VFHTRRAGKVGGREERVTGRKPHALRVKIALRKMRAADPVVICLEGCVFIGFKHGDDLWLNGKLKQVVTVPCVGSNRLAIAFQQLHFGMDGEHLLDERTPEMQQSHGEGPLIVRPQRQASLVQELAKVGTQRDHGRGFPATRRTCFQQHAVGYLAGTAKALRIGEPVVPAESADGPGFVRNKLESRVRADRVTEFLELAVDGVLAARRLKSGRIEKYIDVFRKPLD